MVERSTAPLAEVPEYVPAELVWDNTPSRFAAGFDDPYLGIAELLKGPEMLFAKPCPELPKGAWIPTRYDLVRDVFMDAGKNFTSQGTTTNNYAPLPFRLLPQDYDPPEHMQYRQVVQPSFNPSAISRYDSMVRGVINELIEKFEHKNSCEFMDEFATPFPDYVFLDLMGLPRAMMSTFLGWLDAFLHSPTLEERTSASQKITDYLQAFMEERRASPSDDLSTVILNGCPFGRPIQHDEIMGFAFLLVLGGLDTVRSSLGWYMRHIAQDSALQERLRANPGDIPAAIEEFLRLYGVIATRRFVAQDIDFHGVTMREGDLVLLTTYLVGRDERQFENPHSFSLNRKSRHLSFGTGAHNCLGAHLARRELKIAIEEFLSRFRNIRVVEESKFDFATDGVWRVNHLELGWERAG